MAAYDNAYSRTVAAAKIILPLFALGLLATMFLLARPAPQSTQVSPQDLTLLEMAREQRLGAPTYSGVTEQGTLVSLSADALRPDVNIPTLSYGEELRATLITPDGLTYDITAPLGQVDEEKGTATFLDMVQITASSGFVIQTDSATLRTDLSVFETLAPITATGPMGKLEAGRMKMLLDPKGNATTLLVFTQGVRLIYTPEVISQESSP